LPEKSPLSDREKKLVNAFRGLEDEAIQEGLVKLLTRASDNKAR